jgi:hypothetical protein
MEVEPLPGVHHCQPRAIHDWRGAPVPWYFFTVLAPDGAAKGAGSTNLLNDDAARHYGHLIIRELKQREGEYDPKLKLVIRNRAGAVSHIIPF